MSEIRKYALVDTEDTYVGHEYDTLNEAKDIAARSPEPVAVVALVYTFDDSELVWTPDGGSVWPPKPTASSGNCEHCGQLVQWDDSIGALITDDVDQYCPDGEQLHTLPLGY